MPPRLSLARFVLLAHRADAVFRTPPALNFGLLAEGVNGLIAATAFALAFARLPGSPWRQGTAFGLTAWALWVVSGTMSAFVWLDLPAALAVSNVAFGLPKCLCIGWGTAWCWRALASPRQPIHQG